jgi:hypothetical protein
MMNQPDMAMKKPAGYNWPPAEPGRPAIVKWQLKEAKDKRKRTGQKPSHKMEEHATQFLLLPAINPCLLLYFGGENG